MTAPALERVLTEDEIAHYPQQPAEPGRWSPEQVAAMSPLGRRLLGVDSW